MIELMVALAVGAIAISMALPAWNGFVGKASVDALSNELESDVALARLEAVRRQALVTLCSGSVSAGVPVCSGSTNWGAGRLIVCNDANQVGACCPDGPGSCASTLSQQTLKVRQPLSGNMVQLKGPASSLVFHSSGLVSSSTLPIAFTVCKPGGSGTYYSAVALRTITLGLAGQLLATNSSATTCP